LPDDAHTVFRFPVNGLVAAARCRVSAEPGSIRSGVIPLPMPPKAPWACSTRNDAALPYRVVRIYTVGHSNRTFDEFAELLTQAAVNQLVDVRSIPRSRAMPQFNQDALPDRLAAAGIGYTHLVDLGGRRHHRAGTPLSANIYWRVAAFRHYADYAETPFFRRGLDALLALASERCCAIMCAEAVWWRCHRRIVADYLLTEGVDVQHIMGPGTLSPATLTPGVRVLDDGTLRYDAADPATSPGGYDDIAQ
jgi:hypothetical protein